MSATTGTRNYAAGAVLYLIVGAIFLSIGFVVVTRQAPRDSEVVVEGEIVDFWVRDRLDDETAKPVIAYTDPRTGTSYELQTSTRAAGDELGTSVSVAFDEDEPSDARRIDVAWVGWLMSAVGAAALGWAVIGLIKHRASRR